MKNYTLRTNQAPVDAVLQRWKGHDFYTTAIVLGIDIGMEGIGISVRKGQEIHYAATWNFPWPKSLADRRAKRAWRHCRKNLQVRMKRLRDLFQKYDIPWFEDRDPALLHSDPFVLRYRALTSRLASKEALSIAIRHIVAHRGHYYGYYNDSGEVADEEGEFPWGDFVDFKKVMSAILEMSFTDEEIAALSEKAAAFGWKEEQVVQFRESMEERKASADAIKERLAAYAREKRPNLRRSPKGIAFPRAIVWEHLEEIVTRHSHLIPNYTEFLAELKIHPREDKSKAIFYYHRKTPDEMRVHFEKKTKKCRYAAWLGLGDDLHCESRDKPWIRKFLALEFLATRRVELANEGHSRVNLTPPLIESLLAWQEEYERARSSDKPLTWAAGKKVFERGIQEAFKTKPATSVSSDFNKQYLQTLQDLLCPSPANRKAKASLSDKAAEQLFSNATSSGYEPKSIRAALQDYFFQRREAVYDPTGRYPQVEFLLGTVARKSRTKTKRHPNRKQVGEVAVEGRLQHLFRDLSVELNGASAPDYCVIEVIGDPPRSEKQKKDILEEMEKRRQSAKARWAEFGVEETAGRSARLRLKLWKQQGGRSPFTGESLGEDPLSHHLHLCHLFPESRGGLCVDDNLVLAPVSENNLQKERTPQEAAEDLAGSWSLMQRHAADMKWSALKREIFGWENSEPPDFGNTTRMSQLARQLYVGIGRWIGLQDIPDPTLRENRRAERLATPSGFLTSVARSAWQMPRKDREDLVHHMVDAITLSFIPPREGLNSVQYGGIFFNQILPESGKVRLSALPLGPDPSVIEKLAADDAPRCPVVSFRSAASKSSLHDQTILGLHKGTRLASSKAFSADKKTLDPIGLRQLLLNTGIESDLVPSNPQLDHWLNSEAGEPLVLTNGQMVKRQRVFATKAKDFFPGLGLAAKPNKSGGWNGIKIFNAGKYEGLEIWKSWNQKRKTWDITLRRLPDPRAMESLLRMGFLWLQKIRENDSLQDEPAKESQEQLAKKEPKGAMAWRRASSGSAARKLLKTLVDSGFPIRGQETAPWQEVEKAIYGSPIPPRATRLVDPKTNKAALICKGDEFLLHTTPEGKAANDGEVFEAHWFRVSAIKSDDRIELQACRRTGWKRLLSREGIASLFVRTSEHDSSFNSSQ